MNTCECGCGTEIPYRRKRRRDDQPRFVVGHNTRVQTVDRNVYIPKPEEIPSGLCECGCGKRTKIAKKTWRPARNFRGHPVPRLKGHFIKDVTRENSHKWKGGRCMRDGYVILYMPDHPMADGKGYVAEHRYVMSEHLGRMLSSSEVVHHKDHDKLNNAADNLELMSFADHMRHHNLETGHMPPSRLGARKAHKTKLNAAT